MARTKEFDSDAVLEKALGLFWERGYEATSMADLVGHLGIARASIYATFGGKRDLYLKALERYLQTRNPNPVDLLSQPGPALPAIRALIEAYAGRLLPRFGTRPILAAGLLIAAGALLLLSVPGVPYAGLAV